MSMNPRGESFSPVSRPALAAAALAALLAGGCGSSSSSSSTPSRPATQASAPTSTSTPPTTASTTTTPGRTGEVSPSGDIPDNQAYVPYAAPRGGVRLRVPEGWSRITAPGYVLFTDKLNSIRIETGSPVTARAELARLARTVPGYRRGTVSTLHRPAGRVTRITYLAQAPPDPVTGKRVTDAVERYLFARGRRGLVLTLSGPKGADNVDPWRIVTTSVRLTG